MNSSSDFYSPEHRLFVGGVPVKMEESRSLLNLDVLKEYFQLFGQIVYFKLAKNKKTKEPLGFGFIQFKDERVTNKVLQQKHFVQGREVIPTLLQIDIKPFKKGSDINDQDEDLKRRKLFVKGLPNSCDKNKLFQAFRRFGDIDKAYILYDHNNGSSRGFGFVEFMKEADLLRSLEFPVIIERKAIKCSRVFLKQEMKVGGEPDPSVIKKTGSTNQNVGQPAKLNDKRKQANLPKIDLKMQQLANIDTYNNCTKNTKDSSGDSSNDYNEYEGDSMTRNIPLCSNFHESNNWDSPLQQDNNGFFYPQYDNFHQPRTNSCSYQQGFDQWSIHPDQTSYPNDQPNFQQNYQQRPIQQYAYQDGCKAFGLQQLQHVDFNQQQAFKEPNNGWWSETGMAGDQQASSSVNRRPRNYYRMF